MSFRIGIAGFLHESNTFLPTRTTYTDFLRTSLVRGEELRERWKGTSHELGGMLAGCEEYGLEALPLYATYAVPGGAIETPSFDRIAAEIVDSVRSAMPIHGLLVALHGATVCEDFPDADGEMLARIREVAGDRVPLVMTFDLHANLSHRMIQLSTAAIGYQTNPHLDQKERGIEAAALLARILRGEVTPVQAIESPPMLIRNSRQHTAERPARALYDDLRSVRSWPGILSASVAMGFPHADVEEMGCSFVAVAGHELAQARRAARWMAERAWSRRAEFTGGMVSIEQAVERAAQAQKTPVVLLDTGDNVGGGSAGNSTALLAEMIRQQVPDGLVILHDPDGVRTCVSAGVRNEVRLPQVAGRVRSIHDGRFDETEVRHGGWTRNDQGLTAVVETEHRHTVILTSHRMAPFSLQQILSLGIQPQRKRALIVKGVVAPRAAYEPVAAEFVLVETPGETADDPRLLPYRRRRRPMYPLEDEARYD